MHIIYSGLSLTLLELRKQVSAMADSIHGNDKFAQFLCRHLVGLSVWYYPIDSRGERAGESRNLTYAGIIFTLRNNWFYLTAGHILEDLEQRRGDNSIKLELCQLMDFFWLQSET